jgi:6-phosphogluconolactonase (cycloisomerase 2 family)
MFLIDRETGKLGAVGESVRAPTPICVRFA